MNIEGLSLDQLRAFLAVVDHGSFTAAARQFGRAQSAVSYSVASLEQVLGLALFDRSGYRPVLTPPGQALLPEMRELVERADRLKMQAKAISEGLEAEVSIVVDVTWPMDRLSAVLAEFQAEFPTVALRLSVEALGGVAKLVLDGSCALGVMVTLPQVPDGLTGRANDAVTAVPVAAPEHPLVKLPSPIATTDLRDQVQIVLSDRSDLTEGSNFNVFSARTWRVVDLGAKRALLQACLGWGTMPRHMVADDLKSGALCELRVEAIPDYGELMPAHVIHRADRALGPAGRWLFEKL